jgi:prepilin-type N-terminal cleavage/methylation domain-containing protein
MRTLETGKSILQGNARLAQYKHDKQSQAGFTLIELLVAISVMAVLLGIAVLVMPNHDERYWRDNLDQLVSSLNLAEDESAISGTPMLAHIIRTLSSVDMKLFKPAKEVLPQELYKELLAMNKAAKDMSRLGKPKP